jgi:hypothetical protein
LTSQLEIYRSSEQLERDAKKYLEETYNHLSGGGDIGTSPLATLMNANADGSKTTLGELIELEKSVIGLQGILTNPNSKYLKENELNLEGLDPSLIDWGKVKDDPEMSSAVK